MALKPFLKYICFWLHPTDATEHTTSARPEVLCLGLNLSIKIDLISLLHAAATMACYSREAGVVNNAHLFFFHYQTDSVTWLKWENRKRMENTWRYK